MKYKSNAKWPPTAGVNNSYDIHDTYEQAQAVCDQLEREGFGGGRKVFPTRAWVSGLDGVEVGKLVFKRGKLAVFKLPADQDCLHTEGVMMDHCLKTDYADYCHRMQAGEIELYSLVEVCESGATFPVVDVEVALTRSSYGGPVTAPTVVQIRGRRNACPPNDSCIPALMEFFLVCGTDWRLSGHGVKNFDAQVDGDLFVNRHAQITATSPRR